jgi:glycosyltransferase involved in cell wall biosynthesis
MPSTLLLVPTYNECTNVRAFTDQVRAAAPDIDILFIDDASPDGTGALLDELAGESAVIQVLHRKEKSGLGTAYREGFAWSLEHGYTFTVCMDADLSHDPADLVRFLKELETHDVVCGSRYLPDGDIVNWPLNRMLLSRGAALYTRLITRMPLTDPTGGFNAYRNEMLARLPLAEMTSNGYSFQIEMKYMAWSREYRVTEIPIVFTERRSGKSKMSPGIIREALWLVGKILLRR